MSTTISSSIKRGLRILSGTLYLVLTLISIPISFKIGGLYCGLSFTVTLFLLYFISTTLSILARKNGGRFYIIMTSILYYCQHSIIASLLYLFLSGFSNIELHRLIENNSSLQLDSLTAILNTTLSNGENCNNSYTLSSNSLEANWVFYYFYYKYIVVPWKFILSHSTPFFTLSEGFFTILAIQAIGETNKWLSYEKNSNSWIITSLLFSGGVITASLYYLYRIYVTPIWELSIQTASLLGFVLSLVTGLSIYGIVSQAGSVIESSLFLAYIVRCIYEISPRLATTATDEILELFKDVWQKHQGNLPIKNTMIFYYYNVILSNIENIWNTLLIKTTNGSTSWDHPILQTVSGRDIVQFLQPIWKFFKNFTMSVPRSMNELFIVIWKLAFESISPAVVVNLCFRILIFYSATRIIPSLQRRDDIGQVKRSRSVMQLIYWYSPCILIAMYAHLILQYSGELKNDLCLWNSTWFTPNNNGNVVDNANIVIVDAWSFWNWCNIFWTILIYASELIGGGPSNNDLN